MSVQAILDAAREYEQWEASGTRTWAIVQITSALQRLFGLTHYVGTNPIVADQLFSRWVYDWASTLQFRGRTEWFSISVVAIAIDSPEDTGVWALTPPRFSVVLIDMSRRWKSLRLELHKAQFYRIWSEDSLNVVLIKGWCHKGN